MNASATPTAAPVFRGWYVVLCCFWMAFLAWGLGFYGVSVYLVRLRESEGWSAGAISTAVTFYNLVMAPMVMVGADAILRWGARRVVIVGALAFGLGAAALPLITSLWQLYLVFVAMAVGFAATGGGAVNAILARWFWARRGLAISIALNGATASGILVTPAMLWLTGALGFAHGLWLLILVLWGIFLPLAFVVLRDEPAAPDGGESVEQAGAPNAPEVPRAALLANRNFQTVTLAFGLGLTAQVGFITHQIAYLATLMSVEAAGWCASMIAVAAMAGRIAGGLLVDRLDARAMAGGNFLLQASALCLLLWSPSTVTIYLACGLFGVTVGNMITLPSIVIQREFAPQHFARAISLVIGIDQVLLAFGPGLLGVAHDLSGSYGVALVLCIAIDVAAAITILWRGRRAADAASAAASG